MNRKINGLIFGSLIFGEERWERRADLRRGYRELEDARRQLDYDLRRGASRWRIAEDEARIREIEAAIRADRRELSRWYRR